MSGAFSVRGAAVLAVSAVAVAAAPAAHATFLGSSGRIAFVRSTPHGAQHIFVITPSGRGLRQLTSGSSPDFTPSWSPGGSLIAFSHLHGAHDLDVFEVRANGTRVAQITHGLPGISSSEPAWSPDGQSIAFTRGPTSGNAPTQIYTMRIDGTRLRQLTSSPAGDSAATWSNGLIAFVQGRPPRSSIWTMRPDGSHKRRLTGLDSGSGHPDFSPTGSMITFDRKSARGRSAIYVMNRDGTRARRVAGSTVASVEPVFSPDATRIAFAAGSAGRLAIYTVTPQGRQLRHLTGGPKPSSQPSWQPTLISPF